MQLSNRFDSKHSSLSRNAVSFEAIGTQWEIDMHTDPATFARVMRSVRKRIDAFDKVYSRFRSDSWVMQLSMEHGRFVLPSDAGLLLDMYRTMYQLTVGAVTPLIGQVLSDAGYDAAYSLQPSPLRQPPAWDDVIRYDAQTRQFELCQPALLDFGAAGKGYLVDLLCTLLDTHGIMAYCIDAGGDMRQRLPHDWQPTRVGMEHPDDASQAVGIVTLGSQSLCASAGNRRRWGTFHHIMHPHTLQPVQDIKAVWVASESALVADAMATCLYFAEGPILQKHFDFTYTIIYSDNSYYMSPLFPGELFTDGGVG